jgi:hypothetical protein
MATPASRDQISYYLVHPERRNEKLPAALCPTHQESSNSKYEETMYTSQQLQAAKQKRHCCSPLQLQSPVSVQHRLRGLEMRKLPKGW